MKYFLEKIQTSDTPLFILIFLLCGLAAYFYDYRALAKKKSGDNADLLFLKYSSVIYTFGSLLLLVVIQVIVWFF